MNTSLILPSFELSQVNISYGTMARRNRGSLGHFVFAIRYAPVVNRSTRFLRFTNRSLDSASREGFELAPP